MSAKWIPVFISVMGSRTYVLSSPKSNSICSTTGQDSCSVGGHIEKPFQIKASEQFQLHRFPKPWESLSQ